MIAFQEWLVTDVENAAYGRIFGLWVGLGFDFRVMVPVWFRVTVVVSVQRKRRLGLSRMFLIEPDNDPLRLERGAYKVVSHLHLVIA